MSTSLRLTVGTIISFFTGIGLIGLSAADTQMLTNNVDSIVGGIIAAISLIGFIEHHIQQSKLGSQTTIHSPTDTTTVTTEPVAPAA